MLQSTRTIPLWPRTLRSNVSAILAELERTEISVPLLRQVTRFKQSLIPCDFVDLFAKAGYRITIPSRSVFPQFDDPGISSVLFRAQEISRYVVDGLIDCGLTGHDWVVENGNVEDVVEVVRSGFPMVRLARIEDAYYTVKHGAGGAVSLEEWPKNRTRYNVTEWLEWYDCAGAEWRDPAEFL